MSGLQGMTEVVTGGGRGDKANGCDITREFAGETGLDGHEDKIRVDVVDEDDGETIDELFKRLSLKVSTNILHLPSFASKS